MRQGNSAGWKVKWFHSIAFKGGLCFLLMGLALLAGILVVLLTSGKEAMLASQQRLIVEVGDYAVANLRARQREVEALVNSLAIGAAQLPANEAAFHAAIPQYLDFGGDFRSLGSLGAAGRLSAHSL